MNLLKNFIDNGLEDAELQAISQKVLGSVRITVDEAVTLYQRAPLSLLAQLASLVCNRLNHNNVYFNQNFHIEPTNVCRFCCRFCSYRQDAGSPKSWVMSLEQIANVAQKYVGSQVTEVHIVGGVYPDWNLDHYCSILQTVRNILPEVHLKAFSAVELAYVFDLQHITPQQGFDILKAAGLNSIPGGGAEIFDEDIRKQICPQKASASQWLQIHEAAHRAGLTSNATMLYGHIENYRHRAQHMEAIRNLQDKTHGFNCFIPLKYRAANNPMSHLGEVTLLEDMKNYAVCRIFFDNIQHIKAYWPMLGVENTQMALAFGADDIDGTIDDTTKIYSMAGTAVQKPTLTVEKLRKLVENAGKIPVERNSLYQPIER